VLRELEREVLDVEVAPVERVIAGDRGEHAVVVVWFDLGVDRELCERIVAWADASRPRIGLIAWAGCGVRDDIEAALQAGFDDVVPGGSSSRELAARVRAVHRRVHWRGAGRAGRVRFAGLTLDTDSHTLWIGDRMIALTFTEMSVVRALMRSGGRTLTRAELLDQAWGSANFEIGERAVDNVVLRLRRKLGTADRIRTVRGVGFRIDPEG
jgi:DNA-binding response OmpR family regulator